MAQRFIAGLEVYDTFSGRSGTIVEYNSANDAQNILAPLYVGPYFVVAFQGGTKTLFTLDGRLVVPWPNHPMMTGGITLLTLLEYSAIVGAGYPG